jgi:hypothetical protein
LSLAADPEPARTATLFGQRLGGQTGEPLKPVAFQQTAVEYDVSVEYNGCFNVL